MQQILHVIVVGFHHKKGCQVEFAFPPLEGDAEAASEAAEKGEVALPAEWASLPSLVLPDGAHNVEQDVVYFLLPSREEPGKTIFGISCYRQISSEVLLNRADDVTRSTVQKSVCVLSRVPLFGVLKAKLQLITQAYFNERDFAKVGVLSQMYGNLCQMFEGDLVDGQGAFMDISVRELVRMFRHRIVLLFKLILLERKVIFHIFPVQRLGDTLIALLSLFPKLLEEGLFYAAPALPAPSSVPAEDTLATREEAEEARPEDIEISFEAEEKEESNEDSTTDEEDPSNSVEEVTVPKETPCPPDPITEKDEYGFPLGLFTTGNLFHPYVGLSFLEPLRNPAVRAFTVGCTNALFLQRKERFDVVVTLDDQGDGVVEISPLQPELRRALTLTTADLRFADYLIKNVEAIEDGSAGWQGGDEWCRDEFRAYLLSLAASARADLAQVSTDFGAPFLNSWRQTMNYKRWIDQRDRFGDLASVPPGHAFAGQLGLSDVKLRVEHSVGGSEQAKKALSALSSTGKQLGETGGRVRSNLTSWFRGVAGQAGQAFGAVTGAGQGGGQGGASSQGTNTPATTPVSPAEEA